MERIAVFVDDADHVQRMLEPMMAEGTDRVDWVMIACAPRLTHRIGKWVAHSSREQWRDRWMARLREEVEPLFARHAAGSVRWMMARGPLPDLTRQLRANLGAGLRVLDARRPRLGQSLPAVDTGASPSMGSAWKAPAAVSGGLSIMLALTD